MRAITRREMKNALISSGMILLVALCGLILPAIVIPNLSPLVS